MWRFATALNNSCSRCLLYVRMLCLRYLAGRAERVSRILKDASAVADAMAVVSAVSRAIQSPADSAAARSAKAIAVSTQVCLQHVALCACACVCVCVCVCVRECV